MKTHSYFILFHVFILVAACSSTSRSPSAIADDSAAAKKIQLLDLGYQIGSDRRDFLVQQLSTHLNFDSWSGLGPISENRFDERIFDRDEAFTVEDLQSYRIDAPGRPPFPLEHRLFQKYRLKLENLIPLVETSEPESGSRQAPPLRSRFECDGDFLYPGGLFGNQVWGRAWEFDWYSQINNGQRIGLQFNTNVNRCVLQYRKWNSAQWTNAIEFAALEQVSPAWIPLMSKLEVCARPVGDMGNDPIAFFWQQNFNNVTCPQRFERIEYLRDPYRALNAKIRGLTGADVPVKMLQTKNPELGLDFSKAPHFDIIWVSSLNFSADLYGSVLGQALRYHAMRGTQVRILIPSATTMRKDEALLKRYMRDLPNIKLQLYKYKVADQTDGNWIDTFHRVNHAKLLIGYSAQDPSYNFLVTGGRNIRDSYLFRDKPMYKRFPWLKNYAGGEEPFIYYDDFEIELRGADVVQSTLAQMLSLWNRNIRDQQFRSTNLNLAFAAKPAKISQLRSLHKSTPLIRQVLSVPFVDGYKLQAFYVQMIDSARKEILLTTPYFRPTPSISDAIDRAAKRGVEIKVLTRIEFAGDGSPGIAEDVNKKGINRHLAELDIYEWTDPESILHAKLLLIDQKLTFISSINLNMRSFLHDIESGVLILDEKVGREMRKEMLAYFEKATPITTERKIGWFNRVLIDEFDGFF